MANRTQALQVRLTDEEAKAFKQVADALGENRARLTRKMIRETINQTPDLLQDEKSLFMVAIRQLVGIAHNLNQITKAIHSGTTRRSVDEKYLSEVKRNVLDVKTELESYVKKTKNRWVKDAL